MTWRTRTLKKNDSLPGRQQRSTTQPKLTNHPEASQSNDRKWPELTVGWKSIVSQLKSRLLLKSLPSISSPWSHRKQNRSRWTSPCAQNGRRLETLTHIQQYLGNEAGKLGTATREHNQSKRDAGAQAQTSFVFSSVERKGEGERKKTANLHQSLQISC